MVRETRVALPLLMLLLSRPAAGQDSLDLEESVARDEAYDILSGAEERFDCDLEEHAMQPVGYEPDVRYVFHVTAAGEECREALVFATHLAARQDKILFRQVQTTGGEESPAAPETRESPIGPLLIYGNQVLIDEVNPEIDDDDARER